MAGWNDFTIMLYFKRHGCTVFLLVIDGLINKKLNRKSNCNETFMFPCYASYQRTNRSLSNGKIVDM